MDRFNAFLTGLLIFSSRKSKKFRMLSEKEYFFFQNFCSVQSCYIGLVDCSIENSAETFLPER